MSEQMQALLSGRYPTFLAEMKRHSSLLYVFVGFFALILLTMLNFVDYSPVGFLILCLFASPVLLPVALLSLYLARVVHRARLVVAIARVQSRSSITRMDEDMRRSENYRMNVEILEGYAGRERPDEPVTGSIKGVVCLGDAFRKMPSDRAVFLRMVQAHLFGRLRYQLLGWEELPA
ncbi:hypothetical protein DYH09_25960 [bacterium CPR1]|nr:hypothetical protein [bacterium CPR1]